MLKFDKIDWPRILPLMGVAAHFLKDEHGPCPICFGVASQGSKKNSGLRRFRFDNKGGTGSWLCSSCGSGYGFSLIQKVTGMSSAQIMKEMEDVINDPSLKVDDQVMPIIPAAEAVMTEEEIAENRIELNKAWDASLPIREGDPVWLYLADRVPRIAMEKVSKYIRIHPGMAFYEKADSGKFVKRGTFPAMLAKAIDGEKNPITLHRTYLTKDGRKAPFEMAKKQMKGVRKLKGAAVRLNEVPGCRTLGVTEGIETGYGVMTGYRNALPVWSFLNAGNLAVADIPRDQFDEVVIFADHDRIVTGKKVWKCDCCKDGHRPGWHFATQLKIKLEAEGFKVVIRLPQDEGWDFADVWKSLCEQSSHAQTNHVINQARTRAATLVREAV